MNKQKQTKTYKIVLALLKPSASLSNPSKRYIISFAYFLKTRKGMLYQRNLMFVGQILDIPSIQ